MAMNVREGRKQNSTTPLQSLLSTSTNSDNNRLSFRRKNKGTDGHGDSHGGDGNDHHVGPPTPSRHGDQPTKRSLFPCHDGEERGCIDAVSALVAAISTAYHASTNVNDKSDGNQRHDTSSNKDTAAVLHVVLPPLLQRSKGAGMVECRESVRDLLRFFGHAPLLHLEGVIWVKMSGERGDPAGSFVGKS